MGVGMMNSKNGIQYLNFKNIPPDFEFNRFKKSIIKISAHCATYPLEKDRESTA